MNISIDQMSVAEKIRTMEVIWDDLCHHAAEMQSPSWHLDVLLQREESISKGTESFTDWETAKKRIREKL
ncbi:MAG: addiction module protein [Nitrospirae bacterium]|nr:addiction module protein [Nitrospirota bacterium]